MSQLAYRIDDQLDGDGAPARVGLHFHLACYVRLGVVSPSPFEGWATFAQIWNHRPDKHRFAIVRRLVLVQEAGGLFNRLAPDWSCWDLYDQGTIDRASRGTPPRAPLPVRESPSEDALTMWALHHA